MVEGKKVVCVCDVSEQVGITTQAGLKNSKTNLLFYLHTKDFKTINKAELETNIRCSAYKHVFLALSNKQ